MSTEWLPFTELLSKIVDNRGKTCPVGDVGIPLIATNCVDRSNLYPSYETTRFVSEETYKTWFRGHPQPGDILFVCKGSPGRTNWVPDPVNFCIAQDMVAVRADPGKVYPKYLFAALRSSVVQSQIDNMHVGTMIPHFKKGDFGKLSIPVPSRSDQREIGDLYFTLTERITQLRETNATLEAIAQALFKSWFVDFDPVHAKMEGRAPEGMDEATAALFPNSFEESELGLVPRGWTTRTMADVSTVGIGKTPPRKEQHWFSEATSDVRWVSIRDMGAIGVYAARTSEFLTQEAIDKFNVRQVPNNTVLMSFKMTIGRVAITDGGMTTNEAIAHFKLAPEAPLTTEYIYLHLKQFDFSTLSSTSSIADAVNSKTVREIQILVPTPDVVAAFQDQVGVLFAKLKNTEQQARTLAALRDTLLPRLISGQLRLPETQAAAEEALA